MNKILIVGIIALIILSSVLIVNLETQEIKALDGKVSKNEFTNNMVKNTIDNTNNLLNLYEIKKVSN